MALVALGVAVWAYHPLEMDRFVAIQHVLTFAAGVCLFFVGQEALSERSPSPVGRKEERKKAGFCRARLQ